jgi:hypothetical protein
MLEDELDLNLEKRYQVIRWNDKFLFDMDKF